MKVTIYSGEGCNACKSAKEYFKQNNIEFEEYNISEDIEAKKFLIKKRVMSVPYIVIDDKSCIGFDKDKIEVMIKGE